MSNKTDNEPLYIDEFDYPLPDERIAKYPLEKRDTSKLLVYKNGKISESKFYNIASFLPKNALLVYNNTRVIHARLIFHKITGARIEVFCLEPLEPSDYVLSLGSTAGCIWKCMVGNLKKWKNGSLSKDININGSTLVLNAELFESNGNTHSIKFSWKNQDISFADILEHSGELPIPPYLNRETEESDLTTYQTVYSKIKGSVAAPTAGLHFTDEVFETLKPKNIHIEEVTLHVGAGTFQPVKSKDVAEHTMHTEFISVHKDTIFALIQKEKNVFAVGTTTVRTLESLYYLGCKLEADDETSINFHVNQWEPYQDGYWLTTNEALINIVDYLERHHMTTLHASTQIIIKPGFNFRIVKGMITNFHQPKSTLLLLVSAFVDGNWKTIYNYALSNDFRFLSYGDSSLLMR